MGPRTCHGPQELQRRKLVSRARVRVECRVQNRVVGCSPSLPISCAAAENPQPQVDRTWFVHAIDAYRWLNFLCFTKMSQKIISFLSLLKVSPFSSFQMSENMWMMSGFTRENKQSHGFRSTECGISTKNWVTNRKNRRTGKLRLKCYNHGR